MDYGGKVAYRTCHIFETSSVNKIYVNSIKFSNVF